MRYFKLAIIILLASCGPASPQLSQTGAGLVAGGGTPPVNCGTGVINLSTGCTQPMLGGL